MRIVFGALVLIATMSSSGADMDVVEAEGAVRALIQKCEPDKDNQDYLLYLSDRFVRAALRQMRLTDHEVEEKLNAGLAMDISSVTCDRKSLRATLEERDATSTDVLGVRPTHVVPPPIEDTPTPDQPDQQKPESPAKSSV